MKILYNNRQNFLIKLLTINIRIMIYNNIKRRDIMITTLFNKFMQDFKKIFGMLSELFVLFLGIFTIYLWACILSIIH